MGKFLTTDLGVVQKFSGNTCVNGSIVDPTTSTYASQVPIGLDTVAYDVTSNYGITSCDQVASSRWVSGLPTWDVKKRHRVGGLCENGCSGHGSCVVNQNC